MKWSNGGMRVLLDSIDSGVVDNVCLIVVDIVVISIKELLWLGTFLRDKV